MKNKKYRIVPVIGHKGNFFEVQEKKWYGWRNVLSNGYAYDHLDGALRAVKHMEQGFIFPEDGK